MRRRGEAAKGEATSVRSTAGGWVPNPSEVEVTWTNRNEAEERQKVEIGDKVRRQQTTAGGGESDEDDEPISTERLNELRMRVASRDLKKRVDRIMYGYYIVLLAVFVNFYFSISKHGIDKTIRWHVYGGSFLCVLSVLLWLVANITDDKITSAAAGMVLITGLPILLLTLFVFVWINLFFNRSWRDAWLSLAK